MDKSYADTVRLLRVPAVSGFRWQSLDSAVMKKLNGDNHLRRSSVFSGSPWKVEVERVMETNPTIQLVD